MMSWTFKVCVILQLISLSQGSDDDFEVSVTSRNLEDSTIINGAQETTENVDDFTVIEVDDYVIISVVATGNQTIVIVQLYFFLLE